MQDDENTVTVEVPAEVVAEAVEAETPEIPLDPNALIAADVAIAAQDAETERARIAAKTEVKIAELHQEEPPWLSDMRECWTRLETRMEAMESRLSSTPPTPAVTTVVVDADPTPEPAPTNEPPAEDDADLTPVEPEAPAPEPAPKPKRRWI